MHISQDLLHGIYEHVTLKRYQSDFSVTLFHSSIFALKNRFLLLFLKDCVLLSCFIVHNCVELFQHSSFFSQIDTCLLVLNTVYLLIKNSYPQANHIILVL